MSASDKGAGGRQPAVLRIKLRHKSLDAFVEKFAENVSHGGIFIQTKQLKPVGTDVRFELLLADGSAAIKGEGRVAFVKEHDPEEPQSVAGMGIKLVKLQGKSREVLKRCLDWKSQHRRNAEVEGATDRIPVHTGQFELPENADKDNEEVPESKPPATTTSPAPSPSTKSNGVDELDHLMGEAGLSEQQLTAALSHLRDQARGKLDDAELDALLAKEAASPVTVDDATAELARMLGGRPVAGRRVHPAAVEKPTPIQEAHAIDEVSALTPPPVNVPPSSVIDDLRAPLYGEEEPSTAVARRFRSEERPAVAPGGSGQSAGLPTAEISAEVANVLDALEHDDEPRDTKVDDRAPRFLGRGQVEVTPTPVDPVPPQGLYDDIPETRIGAAEEEKPPEPPERRKSGFFKKLFGK